MSHFYDPDLEAELRDAGRMVARRDFTFDERDFPGGSEQPEQPRATGEAEEWAAAHAQEAQDCLDCGAAPWEPHDEDCPQNGPEDDCDDGTQQGR